MSTRTTATVNPKVLSYVRSALKRNPDRTNQSLYEKASEMDPEIVKMSLRRFHALYPLQVKREIARERQKNDPNYRRKPRAKGRKRTKELDRGFIRDVLLDLASKVAQAQSNADVISVVGDVDTYVERIAAKVEG